MFADPKAYEKLAELKKKDLSAWERFKEAIKKLLDSLKELIGAYDVKSPGSDAAMFVEGFTKDVYDKLQDLYIKAFASADEKFAQKEASGAESDTMFSHSELDSVWEESLSIQNRINELRKNKKEIEASDEYKDLINKIVSSSKEEMPSVLEEYNAWVSQSKYDDISNELKSLQTKFDELRTKAKEMSLQKEVAEQKKKIQESGLSESEYFRNEAVKEFGYTPYFYDAGYLLPNGKLLNFSGEKGKHYGTRGQDHRAIGTIYAGNVNGSKAMLNFMSEGNIRVMAETPGIDISSVIEPTSQQYTTIRRFVREYAKEGYLAVDITDKDGRVVGTYSYENNINAERVVNDIKYYFQNGELRKQSSISDFLYSDSDVLYSDSDIDNRQFTYNELVAKGDLVGVSVDNNKTLKMKNGVVDASWLVNEVRKGIKSIQTKAGDIYYTEAPDIGRIVEIVNRGLTHGFTRPNDIVNGQTKQKAVDNAIASLNIAEILRNSIEVNRSKRGTNKNVPYTHVMMGVIEMESTAGNKEYYAVRSMVQERINENPILVDVDVLGTLTSTNAKKIGSPTVRIGNKPNLTGAKSYFTYNIAQFLQDVKSEFNDTFSNDVYSHLGMQRKSSDFSENLLYSEQDSDKLTNRVLLANALESVAQNDIEKKRLEEYKDKLNTIYEAEKQLADIRKEANALRFKKGRTAAETQKLKSLDEEAGKIANRITVYDRQLFNLEATAALKGVLYREREKARKKANKKNKEILANRRETLDVRESLFLFS